MVVAAIMSITTGMNANAAPKNITVTVEHFCLEKLCRPLMQTQSVYRLSMNNPLTAVTVIVVFTISCGGYITNGPLQKGAVSACVK